MKGIQTSSPQPRIAALHSRAAQLARVLKGSLRTRGGGSLPRLVDAHPIASHATRRWRGLSIVPVSAIVGTASVRPGTRGTDFLPTRGHEPADWQGRWRRLRAAARDLRPLPPIELVKAGDGYWVADGHNRVALAKSTGQLWIDADVTELILPSASAQQLKIIEA
jgi:hypothetical protein